MKKTVNERLNGLLNPTPAKVSPKAKAQDNTQEPEKVKGNYKTVCYSIAPDVADKIKYIAYYDRRKVNAVVTEAFEEYIAKWVPAQEKPKKL